MIICQIKLDIFPERQAKIEAEISILEYLHLLRGLDTKN